MHTCSVEINIIIHHSFIVKTVNFTKTVTVIYEKLVFENSKRHTWVFEKLKVSEL